MRSHGRSKDFFLKWSREAQKSFIFIFPNTDFEVISEKKNNAIFVCSMHCIYKNYKYSKLSNILYSMTLNISGRGKLTGPFSPPYSYATGDTATSKVVAIIDYGISSSSLPLGMQMGYRRRRCPPCSCPKEEIAHRASMHRSK